MTHDISLELTCLYYPLQLSAERDLLVKLFTEEIV